MLLLALLGMSSHLKGPVSTPYRSTEKLLARTIVGSKPSAVVYEPVDFKITASATFENPFDSQDVSVKVTVEEPGGTSFEVPGYFSIDCERKLEGDKEVITKTGKTQWNARISFLKPGQHRVTAIVKDRSGTSLTDTYNVDVSAGDLAGFVKKSERDHRYFETSNGASFYPVGSNVCWAGSKGTYDYDTWLPKYGEQGANFMRVWLAPGFFTFGLEQKGASRDGKGIGVFSLESLWKLDYVVALARKSGLRIKFCVESFNVLREKDGYNAFEEGPHTIANGGILHSPAEFWENAEMDRIFLNKMRYLIGRYAADPTVFAWELWNEVDLTTGFPADKVKDWHQRMAREIRKMDPYKHLITTSFADSMGTKDIDMLDEIDFIQTHNYSSPDVISQVANQQSRKGSWGKPHYVGEIGADWAGPRGEEDPLGLQIHDPLWISTTMGSSGAAMPWWWDNYIEPKNLYSLFGAVARFVKGIDWPREDFRQTQPKIDWRVKPSPLPRRDLSIPANQPEWAESAYNKPRAVKVTEAGASGQLPIAGIAHGKTNHPTWHNPVTFSTQFTRPTTLEVIVDSVSGWGGAKLAIELNGSPYLTRDFPQIDPNNHETIHKYDGTYAVTIPAGKQTVTVKNIGADWMTYSVRFKDALVRENPPIVSWATVGNTVALAWMRVEDRSWRRLIVLKESIPPAPPTTFSLGGLASGNWNVELWDTWKGEVIRTEAVKVGIDGNLKLTLPQIDTDIALKAVKQ